jgi:hypothetical protein
MKSRALLVLLLAALPGCATKVRFRDAPVVWYVDDERSVPKPKERKFAHLEYFVDILGFDRLQRTMKLPDLEEAHNVNALDEVPNSTWFTNRIGVRTISPAEAALGPTKEPPPELPFTIKSGKSGGRNPGFIAEDATGRDYVVKFDREANPDMQTGTNQIVNRIFWAIGFNVAQDSIVSLRPGDVIIAKDAKVTPPVGRKRLMTQKDLAQIFADAPEHLDGTYRATASLFLEGEPLGGPPAKGTRKDDPNDRVRHEHRREMRGLRVFCAWVSHTDMKEDNMLDMYVEEDGRKFVRHYFVDFGEALGAHRAETGRMDDGWEFVVDWEKNFGSLFSLGLWVKPWERERPTPWLEVGAFEAEKFDPERWREAYPFWPFFEMTPADAYWAAKIVMRFDRPVMEAIVAEAHFRNEPSEYLVDTLLARARKIGKAYIESVTALDWFRFEDGKLCGWDLGIVHGLADWGIIERMRGRRVIDTYGIENDGHFCIDVPKGEPYRVLRLRVRRGSGDRPVMQVHVATDGEPRVLGIVRSEKGPCIKGRGRRRCR